MTYETLEPSQIELPNEVAVTLAENIHENIARAHQNMSVVVAELQAEPEDKNLILIESVSNSMDLRGWFMREAFSADVSDTLRVGPRGGDCLTGYITGLVDLEGDLHLQLALEGKAPENGTCLFKLEQTLHGCHLEPIA